MSQIHPEAYTALMTERAEVLLILRDRLNREGKLTYDADLLISALQQAVEAAHEYKHRLNEITKVMRDHVRSLEGATSQALALRQIAERGGSYQSALERDATDKLWPQDMQQGGSSEG